MVSIKSKMYVNFTNHTFTRIDHFFVDDRIAPQVSSCDYQSIVISDHAPFGNVTEFSRNSETHKALAI